MIFANKRLLNDGDRILGMPVWVLLSPLGLGMIVLLFTHSPILLILVTLVGVIFLYVQHLKEPDYMKILLNNIISKKTINKVTYKGNKYVA